MSYIVMCRGEKKKKTISTLSVVLCYELNHAQGLILLVAITQIADLSINFVCQPGISVYPYKEDQLFEWLAN